MSAVITAMERGAEVAVPVPAAGTPSQRLVSLDVFRGITIAGMVLVNNPGDGAHVYTPLEHAAWHGWTPTDLIFPFFVYIVGVAMIFSFGKLLERGATRGELMLKAVKRSAMIYAMGLAIVGFASPQGLFQGYHLEQMRILGVLERIAIAYLAASAIYLYTKSWKSRAIWAAAILVAYWALMVLVPVPGVGAGVLEPGKNLSNWIDQRVIPPQHVWPETTPWDPEGILSTMGAIGTCLIGVLVGQWIRSRRSQEDRTIGLFVLGTVLLAAGLVWGGAFPINKKIWTSSYVLFTGGFASIVLALCYWTADVKGWRWWTRPLVVFGTNALALYVLSGIGERLITWVVPSPNPHMKLMEWLYATAFAPFFTPINASLAWAIFYVLVWLGIMWVFYAKKIFIKV